MPLKNDSLDEEAHPCRSDAPSSLLLPSRHTRGQGRPRHDAVQPRRHGGQCPWQRHPACRGIPCIGAETRRHKGKPPAHGPGHEPRNLDLSAGSRSAPRPGSRLHSAPSSAEATASAGHASPPPPSACVRATDMADGPAPRTGTRTIRRPQLPSEQKGQLAIIPTPATAAVDPSYRAALTA